METSEEKGIVPDGLSQSKLTSFIKKSTKLERGEGGTRDLDFGGFNSTYRGVSGVPNKSDGVPNVNRDRGQ